MTEQVKTQLEDLGAKVGALLKERRQTVAVAESSTGGLISSALLVVPGASAYFLGGGVIYTAPARKGLLGIGAAEMEGIRSSSEPYALVLAHTVRDRLGGDWGLSETGAAGPSGNRYGDAPGHTCIAVVGTTEEVITLETARDGREENMWEFARAALELLEAAVRKSE